MKRKITIILLLLITLVASSQVIKYINTSELNIRDGAGTEYKIITKVVKNDKVTVLSERGKWSQIELENGLKGYVSTKFLSDNENSGSLNTSKDTSLVTYFFIFGLIVVIFGINKLSKFLGISSNSTRWNRANSSSDKSNKKILQPKVDSNISNKGKFSSKSTNFYCKYCGASSYSISSLTGQNCLKSPSRKHELYEGDEKTKYFCKYCGSSSYSLSSLTGQNCSKSPTKKHHPAI